MTSINQSDHVDDTEEKLPSYRWVMPYGALLVTVAIGAVVLAVHIMAVPLFTQ